MNPSQRQMIRNLGEALIRHSTNPDADLKTIAEATRQIMALIGNRAEDQQQLNRVSLYGALLDAIGKAEAKHHFGLVEESIE